MRALSTLIAVAGMGVAGAGLSQTAQAGNWSIGVGIAVPGIVEVEPGPAYVYTPPPVYYPPPGWYAPRYVYPPPYYYYRPPVVAGGWSRDGYEHRHGEWHHHHEHDHDWDGD